MLVFNPASVKSLLVHRSELTLTFPFVRFLAIVRNSHNRFTNSESHSDSASAFTPWGKFQFIHCQTWKREKICCTYYVHISFRQKLSVKRAHAVLFTGLPQAFPPSHQRGFPNRSLIDLVEQPAIGWWWPRGLTLRNGPPEADPLLD